MNPRLQYQPKGDRLILVEGRFECGTDFAKYFYFDQIFKILLVYIFLLKTLYSFIPVFEYPNLRIIDDQMYCDVFEKNIHVLTSISILQITIE